MRKAAVLAFIALACAGHALARGEWFDHYLDGVEALEAGDAETAANEIRQAIGMRPKPGYYRTYGNNYVRYNPYFHLGAALHDLGDCERALAAFARSAAEGELERQPALAARRDALREACRARLAPPPPVPAAEPGPPAEAPEQPQVRVPRPLLARAVEAYLDGDYEEAAGLLERLLALAPRSATLHALRGCVLAAAAEAGEPGADMGQARRELARALALDPTFELDARFFSPRLLALLRRAGADPGR